MTLEDFAKNKEKMEGYLWDSDAEYPRVLRDEEPDVSKYINQQNPYIVEALLYSKGSNCAWMIKHTGNSQVTKFDLNQLPANAELVSVDYTPHRLKSKNPEGADPIKRVCFKQLWIPEEDANCADMEVLKMQALIFTGFNHQPKSV